MGPQRLVNLDATPTLDVEQRAQRLEALLSTLAAGVVAVDLEGRITYANASALRVLGVSEAELLGQTPEETGFECYLESGTQLRAGDVQSLARCQDVGDVRAVVRCVRGARLDVWLDSQLVPMRSSAEQLTGAAVSFIDVSERFRLQAAERAAFRRMNDVLQAMASGVLLVDADGRIEFANPAAAGLSGLQPKDVVGQLAADPAWQLTDSAGEVLPYDALPVPTTLRERRKVQGVELGVPTMAGVMRWMRVSTQPLFEPDGKLRGAVVTTEDTTERHNLAEQLLQAQKLEAIGQLAGGVAHDFNNLLTVILGNAELALLLDTQNAGKEVTEIRDAANRGAALTRQLLTFARRQVVQARPVELDLLIDAVEGLLRRALGESITLRRTTEPELWPVRVDPGQMEQVLVNMSINARDAMPRGGLLTIETHNVSVGVDQAQRHEGVEPGEFALLSIADDGIGMRRDLVGKIFDPFFTTKPLGSGTGLGLSICHGVVKQAHGFIDVDTEPGRGTCFKIYLPRCADSPSPSPNTAPLSTAVASGQGTILLVEDQDSVRSLVERALTGYGYRVVSASGGHHALKSLQDIKHVDLLLTDMVMPEMGGIELANILQQRLPGLPVLYMTGYVDENVAALSASDAQEKLLLKPFPPMQLLQRVQAILSPTALHRR